LRASGPVSDQAWKSQTVLARTMRVESQVHFSIRVPTSGWANWESSAIWTGPHGPLRFWNEILWLSPAEAPPLSMTARQRPHVEIGIGHSENILLISVSLPSIPPFDPKKTRLQNFFFGKSKPTTSLRHLSQPSLNRRYRRHLYSLEHRGTSTPAFSADTIDTAYKQWLVSSDSL
jgi:hypothetical protein